MFTHSNTTQSASASVKTMQSAVPFISLAPSIRVISIIAIAQAGCEPA